MYMKKATSKGYQSAENKKIDETKPEILEPLKHPTEAGSEEAPAKLRPGKRVGFAFVGLGTLTLNQLLPAIIQCKYAKLAALVSGDRKKAEKTALQYGLDFSNIYNYKNFDAIKDNPNVDVVYIVLPNSMHEEFTVRAAKAGKHILCEKPMATTVAAARRMIAACKKADKKLMIAYRMQFEPFAAQVKEMISKEEHGKIRLVESVNVQNSSPTGHWRLNKKLAGGGCLPDIGLYNINTTRYLLGKEPNMVLASNFSTPGDKRFKQVEETSMFQLFFPDGTVANNTCSYGVNNHKSLNCYGDKGGKMILHNAFAYNHIKLEISSIKNNAEQKLFPSYGKEKDQFGLEMDHMADCVLNDKTPYTPGEEGLQDQIILEAIYKSAKTQKPVKLKKITKKDAFRGSEPVKE